MTDMTDETMDAITRAVELGRAGDADAARSALVDLWAAIGPEGDALHRCTLAHYLADLYDDAAQALMWDVRALDAADALGDARVQQYHAGLAVRGFYPSLHLNLADNLRRLGSFDAARAHVDAAAGYLDALGDDDYGQMIRGALDGVGAAIAEGFTALRASAP
ncbi:hypothetical protein [Prescottella agglutinans]|uniref:hypothetical protein n=1 Tax=Prescottella agglutinans TaxID=1644129 RepID=UPI003D968605